jgi:hypothetical protein
MSAATKADASMRALVRGVLEKVGVRPFLTAIQRRRPQRPAGDTTTPTTPTQQRSDSAYQPHPDTLGFLVRCMTAMVSEGTLTPQVLPDAYRLATLATQLLKKSAGHGASNFGVYRSLLQFYRASGGTSLGTRVWTTTTPAHVTTLRRCVGLATAHE